MQQAEQLAGRRSDPDHARQGPAGIEVARRVRLHAVADAVALGEQLAGPDAVGPDRKAHDPRLGRRRPGREVEPPVVRRQGDPVGFFAQRLAADHLADPAVLPLPHRVRHLGQAAVDAAAQTDVRVGEIDRPVGGDRHVVGPVEALALEVVGQHGARSVRLQPLQRPVLARAPDHPALPIDAGAVGPDQDHVDAREIGQLAVVGDVRAAVPGRVQEHRDPALRRELVDHIADDAADQQISRRAALAAHPDGPVGKAEPGGHGPQLGVRRDQPAQRRTPS